MKRKDNTNYIIGGMLLFIFLIFAVMISATISKDDPPSERPYGMGDINQILQDINSAESYLQDNPADSEVLEVLGNLYYGAGYAYKYDSEDQHKASHYFEHAIAYYQQVLEEDPNNINVRIDMATVAFWSEDYAFAKKHFLKGIESHPEYLNARINYGVFLAQALEEYKEAMKQWQIAKELDPANSEKYEDWIESVRLAAEN
ncbi:tetratricopeptide (TPR) repeat protein [Desulfitispora alkaliphila]|uniref:tetratricopeptide repeat protein n=1 Tax=Desulfitispora alkaliphila TaxID=622674 RepID=UPI003D1DB31B